MSRGDCHLWPSRWRPQCLQYRHRFRRHRGCGLPSWPPSDNDCCLSTPAVKDECRAWRLTERRHRGMYDQKMVLPLVTDIRHCSITVTSTSRDKDTATLIGKRSIAGGLKKNNDDLLSDCGCWCRTRWSYIVGHQAARKRMKLNETSTGCCKSEEHVTSARCREYVVPKQIENRTACLKNFTITFEQILLGKTRRLW